MARGSTCPGCGKDTYQNEGSYRKCSSCGYIGWGWKHIPKDVGSGRGNRCPDCKKLKLHDVVIVGEQFILRRCTTCNYTALQPINYE